MQVKDVLDCKSEPITIHANQEMPDAMRLMIDNKIGSLVVVDDKKNPVGIITEHDIFMLAYRYRGDMMDMKVGDNMTTRLIMGRADDEIEKIGNTMIEKKIRHIPIVDESNQLCGIISIGDVLKTRLAQPA